MRKKLLIILGSLLVILITFTFAFGRYVYNYAKDYYLGTKGFYFNSKTMGVNGTSHKLNNWDGVNDYNITLDVNNRKNEYIHTESDITYEITYECSSNIICTISKTSGTIQSDLETDSYIISFKPNYGVTFSGDDYAVIKTSVKSTYPYEKTLSTEYEVGIETLGFSYNVTDNTGDKYVTLELNNAITYYEVTEAFSTYSVGDHISSSDYNTLSDDDKNKCKSAIVTLTIDTSKLRMDMLDDIYIKSAYDITTTSINGSDYVNGFKFKMGTNSTVRIKMYKLDASQNYNGNLYIIGVNADLAE